MDGTANAPDFVLNANVRGRPRPSASGSLL